MTAEITSKWYGPFRMIPMPSCTWVAEVPEALKPGLYLWTVRVGDEYRVHYVGMSTNSITARTMEHLSRSFGVNTVNNPESLRQGVKDDYLFYPGRHKWEDVCENILPSIIKYLEEIRLFIAPIDVNTLGNYGKHELERVESALISMVRNYESGGSPFLTNNRLSRVVTNPDIKVNIALPEIDRKIAGLSSPFYA